MSTRKRSFFVAAPQLRNNLLRELHMAPSLLIFKRELMIVFFKTAFD